MVAETLVIEARPILTPGMIDAGSALVCLWRTVYPNGVNAHEVRASGVSIGGRFFEGAYFYLL